MHASYERDVRRSVSGRRERRPSQHRHARTRARASDLLQHHLTNNIVPKLHGSKNHFDKMTVCFRTKGAITIHTVRMCRL